MQMITTIGLDIAKSVFQVHGVDAAGQVVIRRQLKRRTVLAFFQKLPPCLVGIEACASSHHWSRELRALGHTLRLVPPAYVKPYVKRQKNDMADAEAICEAVTRANMRFVPTKTPEQQSCLMLHRTRHLFVRQQTAVINSIRAHPAEFGIVAPVGRPRTNFLTLREGSTMSVSHKTARADPFVRGFANSPWTSSSVTPLRRIPCFGERIPCSLKTIPCYAAQNSLFRCVGNFTASH